MSGRLKQPVNLLLLKGRSHLTKTEIAERKANEITVKADKVDPPKYLSKKLQKEFTEIADELLRIGLISNLDVDALARFLLAREQYIRVTNALKGTSVLVTAETKAGKKIKVPNEYYGELLISQDKLFKQCRQAAADLGLTITSRCRLVVPKKEEPKKTPFDERFGGV